MQNLVEEKKEIEKFQESLETWDLMGQPETEQVAEIAKFLSSRIASAHQKAPVTEILTHEDLFSVVSEALKNCVLPDDEFVDHPDREALKTNFSEYCQRLSVKPAPAEALMFQSWDKIGPLDRFIRIRTLADMERQFLEDWGQSGYVPYLETVGGLLPTFQELRLVYFLTKYFEFVAVQTQAGMQKIQAATEQEVQTFAP